VYTPALSEEVLGAGSTFVYPVLAKWAEAYEAGTGVKIKYQAVGSGAGIRQIKSRTVDFGASDAPFAIYRSSLDCLTARGALALVGRYPAHSSSKELRPPAAQDSENAPAASVESMRCEIRD
jgi:hypothetical protein